MALVLTTGTFAFTYTNSGSALQATLSDTPWATYQVSDIQPDWDSILPQTGAGSITLVPNSPGDDTTILVQFPDSGEHWDKVKDQPPDGLTTYLSTDGSSSWQGDLYNVNDLPLNVTGVDSVTLYAVYASGGSWTARAITELFTEGQQFSGPTESTGSTSWVTISTVYNTNPATDEAWTIEEVNAMQIGVSLKGPNNNREALCTAVYAVVNYQMAGSSQGSVPQGDLFEVTPDADYTGDLLVKIYIMNIADLIKAYQYLNISVYTSNSVEAGGTPDYRVLSLENGVVEFNIIGGLAAEYVVSVSGGSYGLLSNDPATWGAEYTLTPEFYCEVTQR